MNARRHEIMPLITQYADNLGRQGLVQKLYHRLAVSTIAFSYGAFLNVLSRAFAQSFDVSQKWFVSHSVTPSLVHFSAGSDDITRSVSCEQVSHINQVSLSRHDREGHQRS